MTFRSVLRRHAGDLALVIGNGINRFGNAGAVNSWDDLLVELARDCVPGVNAVPPGTALTEFYDVVELRSRGRTGSLQAEFCEVMKDWRPFAHHVRIVEWAVRHRAPVLTTNFDEVLSRSVRAGFHRASESGFTAFYPWGSHFAFDEVDDPSAQFAIWHVNGMARYRTSIRLGLTHYMGSVQRARGWMHGSGDENLFRAKDRSNWRGALTWMQVVFNKPLLIFGLGLAENEVFLRWLLIERAKYFRAFPDRQLPAWYAYVNDPRDERQAGKLFFLEQVGVNCVEAATHAQIYTAPEWMD